MTNSLAKNLGPLEYILSDFHIPFNPFPRSKQHPSGSSKGSSKIWQRWAGCWMQIFLEYPREPFGVVPLPSNSDHQEYYIFSTVSGCPINLHLPLLLGLSHTSTFRVPIFVFPKSFTGKKCITTLPLGEGTGINEKYPYKIAVDDGSPNPANNRKDLYQKSINDQFDDKSVSTLPSSFCYTMFIHHQQQ